MKATKEHIEFTAALINAAQNGTPAFALAILASAKFAEDNPDFNAYRFKEACGVDTDGVACVSDTGVVAWAAEEN